MFIGYKETSVYGVLKIGLSYKPNRLKIELAAKRLVTVCLQGRILKEKISPTVKALTLKHGWMRRDEPTSGVISYSIMAWRLNNQV